MRHDWTTWAVTHPSDVTYPFVECARKRDMTISYMRHDWTTWAVTHPSDVTYAFVECARKRDITISYMRHDWTTWAVTHPSDVTYPFVECARKRDITISYMRNDWTTWAMTHPSDVTYPFVECARKRDITISYMRHDWTTWAVTHPSDVTYPFAECDLFIWVVTNNSFRLDVTHLYLSEELGVATSLLIPPPLFDVCETWLINTKHDSCIALRIMWFARERLSRGAQWRILTGWFFKKKIPWVPHLDEINNVSWWRRSAASEQLITHLA